LAAVLYAIRRRKAQQVPRRAGGSA
jgi:hypothetical protein